ncbi:Heat stress transcription factor A-8 [Morus notabilis]|uniref:Heat stress transcription factor A-8 n=1 Tax=Morus notabilis TaxID=981085 RepID=W9R141_9ROSA|nr:heat stress transcription factor A-8 [Morus notabilis]EXB53850.1 Heat stress transcription factor A-8 [Morus notabilis]
MVKSRENGDDGSVAPFLRKCYEMVGDNSTDSIISWNDTGDCFVIWDMTQFSVQLLPKFFKHSNFSSFMRQLNIYGFRKVDTDHWIFASDGFIRGQKHLLKNICRRKNTQGPDQRKASQQKEHQPDELREKVQNGLENGMWKEVENLKTDKNVLMQELVKLQQHQEISENKLLVLRDRLQGLEKNQQQMLSFLVMAMQSPGFFVQLLQPKENNWRVAEAGNMLEQGSLDDKTMASDGMIVRYQSPMTETSDPAFTPTSGAEKTPDSGSYPDGMQDFFLNSNNYSDFLKVLMDEKLCSLESHSPLVLPDTDDGSWRQLLLASRFLENVEETKEDGEETVDSGMEAELTLPGTPLGNSQNFDLFGMESTVSETNLEKAQYMDTLTEQMGLLSSEPKNRHGT